MTTTSSVGECRYKAKIIMAKDDAIDKTNETPPAAGEVTGNQQATGYGDVINSRTDLIGFDEPPSGTYKTYRKMRTNPTVAIARAAATAPMRLADKVYKARDDAPADALEFVTEQIDIHWSRLLRAMLLALDYGWAPFEKVWGVSDGKFVYDKLKPLRVDITKPLEDKATGAFAGLTQGKAVVPVNKSFVYSYDSEAGNVYGRSRHENIRENAWFPWTEIAKRQHAYATKVAGVIPMIEYPEGKSRDKNGNDVDNFVLAQRVLAGLGKGDGVAMPNIYSKNATDLARAGVSLDKLRAWNISFIETKGMHGDELTNMMRHKESLIMRGWLVPERVATEGQFGTKAEAGEHAEIGLMIADLDFAEMLQFVSWYLIDPLLFYNYGPEAIGSVWVESGGLGSAERAFVRSLVAAVLGNPQSPELFLAMLDINAVLDAVNLPKASDHLDAGELLKIAPAGGEGVSPLTASVMGQYGIIDSLHQAQVKRFAENDD